MLSLHSRARRAAVVLTTALAFFGLAACGGSDETPKASATTASPEATESAPESPSASGDEPEWANPVTQPGDKLSSFKVGDIAIDIYQVGTVAATKAGNFVDPDENKPIIDKGDDIVFVNYVITNNGDPIDLGSSLVDISGRYDDWPYLQGMDSITDSDLYEDQKVNNSGLAAGAFKDPSVYTFKKGETFSYGTNFRHQKDSPIKFKATVTPVDASGDLIHDKRTEGSGTGTIK